jgi:hypothetical protein
MTSSAAVTPRVRAPRGVGVLRDSKMTTALLDCLTHHGDIVKTGKRV